MAQAYRKVRGPQERPTDANEVRITKKKPLGNYAKYVLSQFRERGATEVTLRQMGRNLDTIVSVAEIVKYRVKGLYQINNIGTQVFEDVFEPLEEGLDTLRFKRTVSFFTITLTKNEPKEKGVGYQEPIPENLVDESLAVPRAPQREGGRSGEGRRGGDNRRRRGGPREGGAGGEGGERRPRPEGENRGERRGPRPEGGEPRGERRPFRGTRGGRGGRGGRRPEGGADIIPTGDGRAELRTRGGQGEGRRGGFRGGERGGDRRGRPPFGGDRPQYDRPPRTDRPFTGQRPQGERRGGRGGPSGPRPTTRGGAPQ